MYQLPFPVINQFRGDYDWCSNFFEGHPIRFMHRDWPTREHLFQAWKCAHVPNQYELMENVRLASTPGEAKRLGRKLPLRQDWDFININVMLVCLGLFLIQYPAYQEKLAATKGSILVEGVWWNDRRWGQPLQNNAIGLNLLGTLWMAIRDGHIPLAKLKVLIDILETEYVSTRSISSSTQPRPFMISIAAPYLEHTSISAQRGPDGTPQAV